MILSGKSRVGVVISILFLAGLVVAGVTGFGSEARSEQRGQRRAVERVKSIEVCMVTDKVFGKPQIPVVFEGKTYYGCCQGCVGRIKNDRSVRYSTDPVTGREVDKAAAYITEGPGGEALYFESAETATKYNASGVTRGGRSK